MRRLLRPFLILLALIFRRYIVSGLVSSLER